VYFIQEKQKILWSIIFRSVLMKKNTRGMSVWGLSMMAMGTVIGGSFFLGSSIAFQSAGPGIVISYILGAILVFLILFSLSEMTVANAATGSFRTFAQQAFGPGVGFVTGWVYWTGLTLAMSSEAIAASLLLRLWLPQIPVFTMGTIIIVLITMVNLLGAEHISKLESSLTFVKIFAIIGFIVLSVALVSGVFTGKSAIGLGALANEPLFPNGVKGIAGSMLIVMFTYAGFETIGLAAPETANPIKMVPKAIRYTVFSLGSLYILTALFILPLIPTSQISTNVSPMVSALSRFGINWAADALNVVLVTAILSAMLAATFGLGRMIRSLSEERHAPAFLADKESEIPRAGILFSGGSMLLGLALSFSLPRYVYIFLVSSGGFSLLFTYVVIVATHYKFRKTQGCPPKGKCQLPGFPYVSWITLGSLVLIIASMPLIPGQGTGLLAGIILVAFYSGCYMLKRYTELRRKARAH
jgi:AAT family amino acid transporter